MNYGALIHRAERLGLNGSDVIYRCQAEAGDNFSSELFLFVCLEMLAEKIKTLEAK